MWIGGPGLEDRVRSAYDATTLSEAEVYPGGWDADALHWLRGELARLRDFYRAAASRGSAVITCLV